MFCKRCGTENKDNMSYCKECGAPLKEKTDRERPFNNDERMVPPNPNPNPFMSGAGDRQNNFNGQQPKPVQQSVYRNTGASVPPGYEPISMWGYFGYELLFCIPIVGFILLLVFSFGGTQNVNLKNFARSYFCLLIIAVIIFLLLVVFSGGLLFMFNN